MSGHGVKGRERETRAHQKDENIIDLPGSCRPFTHNNINII